MRKKVVYCYYHNIYLLCYLVPFSVIFIDKTDVFVYNDTHGAVKTTNDLSKGQTANMPSAKNE